MNKSGLYTAAVACIMGCATANAASFRVEMHPRGYVLYSTYEKPEQCAVNIYFTFMHEGERTEGESHCAVKLVPEGKDVVFCEFSHERMVDPIVSGPLKIACAPPK